MCVTLKLYIFFPDKLVVIHGELFLAYLCLFFVFLLVYGTGQVYLGVMVFLVSVWYLLVVFSLWCTILFHDSVLLFDLRQIGELGNLSIHLALRDLRPPGKV